MELSKLWYWPVIMKDELQYFGEVNLLDEIRVTIDIAGLSEDGSRFCIRNEFYLANGKKAAIVTYRGVDGFKCAKIDSPSSRIKSSF